MQADSRQTDAIAGWWADPVAGLVMAPIIAKEGIDGLRGEGVWR